jgi:hypothetical protein
MGFVPTVRREIEDHLIPAGWRLGAVGIRAGESSEISWLARCRGPTWPLIRREPSGASSGADEADFGVPTAAAATPEAEGATCSAAKLHSPGMTTGDRSA